MGLKKFALLPFLLFIAVLPVLAQRDSIGLTTIVSKTEKLSTEHPFEKVYLHFDKPYYAVGDTIWFKAYLTIGPNHQPSGLSRIIYVDVIGQDSIVKSLKLPTINGVAFGDVTLSPKFFKQGNYHIRAYTNWMRNFGADYFFNKTISIGGVYDKTAIPKISFTKIKKSKDLVISARMQFKDREGNVSSGKKVSWTVQNDDETISKGTGTTDKNGFLNVSFDGNKLNSPETAGLTTGIELGNRKIITNTFPLKALLKTADVQFFPEGGELISGVRSKVAFKAVNSDGIGIDVTGSVIDNTGNEVTTFASQHAGMGIFALLPENEKTYKAVVLFPDGSKNIYDLPNVQTEGINLAVNNSDPENIDIKIATNAGFFKEYKNKGFYIIAQSGGTVYYTGLASLQSLVYTGSVHRSKFPTGILQVTLFAANGEPLSERLVFIQHNDALDISLNTDLPAYATKQHVKMTVTAKNKTAPVEGSFSVAVIDENKVPVDEDAETTIMSSILLTSDLRGYIEKPNYYFNHSDNQKLADMDVLMLTQGYRRFSYTNILADKYPPVTFSPEKGIVVSGTLRTGTGLPVFKGIVNLKLPDRNISVNGVTDADGHFSFSNVAIFDSTKVVLNARTYERSNNLMIMADIPAYQPLTKNYKDPNAIINIDSVLNVYLQNRQKQDESSHVLKEVVIKSTKIERVTHQDYSALSGLSPQTDQTISPEQLKNCSFDIVTCIESNVFGLWHADDNFYIKRAYDAGNKKPVQFFVNGLAVDYAYLTSMHTEDVASIEVYLKDGVSGINDRYGANGIVSITTRSGTFTPKEKPEDMPPLTTQGSTVTIMPKGYYRARVFYSPKYDKQSAVQQLPDLRSTIYWEPNIITDKSGTATLEYYNSDGRGTYRAVIEGIDNDGNIGRYVLRYRVR
jgi:hypothetical protein